MLIEIIDMDTFSRNSPDEFDSHEPDSESLGGLDDRDALDCFLVSPRSLPGYGELPKKAVSQDIFDDNVLVDYFAGWACQQSRALRRFVVISPTVLKRWAIWHHVSSIALRKTAPTVLPSGLTGRATQVETTTPERFLEKMKITVTGN